MSDSEKILHQPKPRRGQQWVKFEMRLHASINKDLMKVADAKGMNRTDAIRDAIKEYICRNERLIGD
jgi:metal-responsive CopG/Arc/MetJ family transcriptional regulator